MADNLTLGLSQLPDEMLSFTILKASEGIAPRLGKLAFPGRSTIQTPHYVGNTSRGVIPHLSQDMFSKHTNIDATPPVYKLVLPDTESPLRRFIALKQDALLIMGARRMPPVAAPAANTNSAISILTSVGFRHLASSDYVAAAQRLRPDIVVGLGDIVYKQQAKPSNKRVAKMGDRTEAWTKDIVAGKSGLGKTTRGDSCYSVFAPILPISHGLQSSYLDELADEMRDQLSGLAIYDPGSLVDLPEVLSPLPRLSFSEPASPQQLLHELSLGMDLFTIPFINAATDAGIALDFTFPPSNEPGSAKRPLGINMWPSTHATDLSPLSSGCECYACTRHHRAYLQHLLAAKEMLGWTLLQVHNHQVMDKFFAGVRTSIGKGSFEEDRVAFETVYEPELPEKTGQGPRVRGYQFKSEGPGEAKKNLSAYRMLDERKELLAEASTSSSGADAKDLEDIGFAKVAERQ
ncbi:hypothetical protein H2201_005176 [Coniosporium apollinis]|uniref:Queuine tRNA-ribosyltransferase accessory subunit 2 n=1 Tax=Coniosporium apollinis TaxID=61459 RepID=A0ABQ9NQI8_9PEZI|nr:hypothetical protein H2201_005176 [Coniosporium apollinis]